MTREEQILNKAIDYSEIEENFVEYDDCGDVCNDKDFVEKAFIEGAKWADENQPGMTKMRKDYELLFLLKKKELIKKACEWLNKTLYIHTEEIEDKHWNEIKTFDWVTSDFDSVSDFIEDFRKAMDE